MREPTEPSMNATLFESTTVYCFFNCGHVVVRHSPDDAHDAMEQHYQDRHRAEIDRILTGGGS